MPTRRQLLAMGAVPIAGCVGATEDRSFFLSFVEILNWSPDDRRVTVEIERNETTLFEDTKTIQGIQDDTVQSWRIDEPWMAETGVYTVRLDGEGFEAMTRSTRDVADAYDLDPDTRCLSWTFLIREDGSVSVYPSPGCPRETDT